MREYDPTLPLAFIHVPKTAGTSLRNLFADWFGEGLKTHYLSGTEPPERHASLGAGTCVYGHFNSAKGFGVQDYYPDIAQFVTVLRDPWERALSRWHFAESRGESQAAPSNKGMSLEAYMSGWPFEDPALGPPAHAFFPSHMTVDNYKRVINEQFVEIGVMERLAPSIRRIADALGFGGDVAEIVHVNAAPRSIDAPLHLKPAFVDRSRLDYMIYEYAASRF